MNAFGALAGGLGGALYGYGSSQKVSCSGCCCPCQQQRYGQNDPHRDMTAEQRQKLMVWFYEEVCKQQRAAEDARLRAEAERWTRLEF